MITWFISIFTTSFNYYIGNLSCFPISRMIFILERWKCLGESISGAMYMAVGVNFIVNN